MAGIRGSLMPGLMDSPSGTVFQPPLAASALYFGAQWNCGIALAWRLPRIEKAIDAIGLREILECGLLVDGATFDEEIWIDFARQEATDFEVRGIFKECRGKIEFDNGKAALVGRWPGRLMLRAACLDNRLGRGHQPRHFSVAK